MANITSYPTTTPTGNDLIIGTDVSTNPFSTKTFTIESINSLTGSPVGTGTINTIPIFTSSTAVGNSPMTYVTGGEYIQFFTGTTRITTNSINVATMVATDMFTTNIQATAAGTVTIKGNTIIGDAATDVLTVNSTSTFASATFLGTLTADSTLNVQSTLSVGNGITLGGNGRIQGLDTVTDGTDAANKTYVDNAVAGGSLTKLVTITSAQILALSGGVNDFELIPAPGAGKIIMIESIFAFLDFNSVGYTITGVGGIFLSFGINPTSSGNISSFVDDTSDSYLNVFSSIFLSIENPLVNVAFRLRNNGNGITLGNSPIKLNIVYKILDATTLA